MRKISEEEILEELKRVYDVEGNIPAAKDWNSISNFSIDVLIRHFGSYKEAWESMGLNYKVFYTSNKKDEIITELKKAFVDNKNAGVDEIIRKSGFTRPTITKYFGSVYEAFKVAKIEVGKTITKEELLEEFTRVCNIMGKVPTEKELSENSKFAVSTFKKRIGSIKTLADLTGFKMETKFKETEDELLEELKRVCELLGRSATVLDLEQLSKFSYNTYNRNFGTYNNALKKIGYEPNKNMKFELKCSICGANSSSMISHYTENHPEELKKQESLVVELYKSGLSARKIACRDDVIFKGGTSINRVVGKYLSKEQKEELRCEKIKTKLKDDYADGKYDWVNNLNAVRNMADEAKQKNSDGLIKSYESGIRQSWNKGLTKENSPIIEQSAEKIKETIKDLFINGEIERKIGPECNKWNENRDEVAGRYRLGLNFSMEDRRNIKKRADYKCEKCGKTQEELESDNKTLECDHIIPICKGGLKDWNSNGQALCPDCHKTKTKEDLV